MTGTFVFDREQLTDTLIDAVHDNDLKEKINGYCKGISGIVLGNVCDNVLDAVNDFLDDVQVDAPASVADRKAARQQAGSQAAVRIIADIYGKTAAAEYCRLRAFEILATNAPGSLTSGARLAMDYLAMAADMETKK